MEHTVDRELAYVKAGKVGEKLAERSEAVLLSYPYDIRHGVPCFPDWFHTSALAIRSTPTDLEPEWARRIVRETLDVVAGSIADGGDVDDQQVAGT